jgi:surfeit locus 1 family protein
LSSSTAASCRWGRRTRSGAACAGRCLRQCRPRIALTGLLRIGEPGGGFLRRNDPANDRWYSRDVQALAAARGLRDAAPFFVDAKAGQEPGRRTRQAGWRPDRNIIP